MIPVSEQSEEDLAFMDVALEMAEEALAAVEIPVGCVLVHNKKIIAKGRNRTNEGRNATLHAEFDALRHLLPDRTHNMTPALDRPFTPQDGVEEAGDDKGKGKERKIWETPLKDVILYVTVEPCLMCAAAMRQVGIERVVYGCANDRFGGCGGVQSIHADPRLQYAPPYNAVGGYRRETAIMQLRRFYISTNVNAPKPKNKTNRVLKTEILDVGVPTTPGSGALARSGTSTPTGMATPTFVEERPKVPSKEEGVKAAGEEA
ncbi:tRNA specific adenosine deaminase [Pseudohyphozyma bogoriensis]|nr:tRNA specific adenosine deaminase [Pseudohyphozyma bogoriensis]